MSSKNYEESYGSHTNGVCQILGEVGDRVGKSNYLRPIHLYLCIRKKFLQGIFKESLSHSLLQGIILPWADRSFVLNTRGSSRYDERNNLMYLASMIMYVTVIDCICLLRANN
jgi:hypothetical protein